MNKFSQTLCWNCAKATGGCDWSSDFKPIEGWTVIPTTIRSHRKTFDSCLVLSCPEFIQDATNYGLRRILEEKNA